MGYEVWHGETDIAEYTGFGGNKPKGEDPRDYPLMFDNDDETMWVGTTDEQNKVLITFKAPVQFLDLRIYTRTGDARLWLQEMCVRVGDPNDLFEDYCTAADFDAGKDRFIIVGPETPPTTPITQVGLKIPIGEIAKIGDLKIHYKKVTEAGEF